MTRRVTILGSAGSIGSQAVEVIAAHPEELTVLALAAAGSEPGLRAEQAPPAVLAADAWARGRAQDALRNAT